MIQSFSLYHSGQQKKGERRPRASTAGTLLSFALLCACSAPNESKPVEQEAPAKQAQGLRGIDIYPNAATGKDATVLSLHPHTNRGGTTRLGANAWTWSNQAGVTRGLLEFDLSQLSGADIRKATLFLYGPSTGHVSDKQSQLSGSNAAVLRRVLAPWSENSVTWANQPATTTEDQVKFGPSRTESDTFALDVTKLINIMVRPGMNHGFMIQLENESYYRSMMFASSDDPNRQWHPRLQIEYAPFGGEVPSLFTSVAFTGTEPCSESDYSRIDNCYNRFNPPSPSFTKSVSQATAADYPYTNTFPATRDADPAAGTFQVLPHARMSNDGRLELHGGCEGCGGPYLRVFRPENVDHDFRVKGTAPPQTRIDVEETIYRLVYFNPLNTALSGARTYSTFPDPLQNNICDVSGTAVTDTMAGAASGTLSQAGRNPKPCTARFTSGSAELPGDCYDVTLMFNVTANDAWEMRSTDVTVFVKQPKTSRAGNPSSDTRGGAGLGLWIYPRNPSGEAKNGTTWKLPPYQPYRIARLFDKHWGRMHPASGSVDWHEFFTTAEDAQCYLSTRPSLVRNPNGPKWCEFFDRQKVRSEFRVDANGNSTMNDGYLWNGRHCKNGERPGAGGGCQAFSLFEPTTSADGRLMLANVNGVFYSYNTLGPCDPRGFGDWLPISFMPKDPNINRNYDIGRSQVINGNPEPFRDPKGAPLPFGALMDGAYPWIDRQGKNLFFSAINRARDGYFAFRAQAPNGVQVSTFSTPTSTQRPELNPDREPGKAVTVLGAWTQGKMVLLDNGLNPTDFGGRNGYPVRYRYDMSLYQGPPVSFIGKAAQSVISYENQLNYLDAFRPTLPFDVVWTMQSDVQRNAEVVFDEYMNNQAFVIAHMNAPYDRSNPNGSQVSHLNDGFVASYPNQEPRYGGTADFRFRENPLLQNASTASKKYGSAAINPPSHLRLRGGARVEPVNMGGVLGRGVYLDGLNDFADFGYPADSSRKSWYLSIWLDNRDESGQGIPRTIFHFPDQSWIGIRRYEPAAGQTRYELVAYNGQWQKTLDVGDLVKPNRYFQLGVKIRNVPRRRSLTFYINGTQVGELGFALPDTPPFHGAGFNVMHSPTSDWTCMSIGDPGDRSGPPRAPFKGWIDELRIYALTERDLESSAFEEFICNTALGTLVDISQHPGETNHPALEALRARAQKHLNGAPSTMCEQLEFTGYLAPLDFPPQYGSHLCIDRVHKNQHTDPSLSARCLRRSKLGIRDKALQAAQPRPDFSGVDFCVTCHHAEAPLRGLKLDALLGGSLPRYLDPRRQPLDVPGVLSGVRPGWFTQNSQTIGIALGDGTHTMDQFFDVNRAVE